MPLPPQLQALAPLLEAAPSAPLWTRLVFQLSAYPLEEQRALVPAVVAALEGVWPDGLRAWPLPRLQTPSLAAQDPLLPLFRCLDASGGLLYQTRLLEQRDAVLSGLRVLLLAQAPLHSADLQKLARQVELAGLHTLDLSRVAFSERDVLTLQSAQFIPSLRCLRLSACELTPHALALLVRSPTLRANLQALDLSHNPLGPEGALRLCAPNQRARRGSAPSAAWPSLHSLDLSCCHLGDEGAGVLSQSQAFPSLSHLDLSRNFICDAQPLVGAFPKLTSLTLLDTPAPPVQAPPSLSVRASQPSPCAPRRPDVDLLGQLRSLLYDPPSPEIWEKLCKLMEEQAGHSAYEVAFEYAQEHLRRWPDALRVVMEPWWGALLAGLPHPALPLARSVVVDRPEWGARHATALLNAPSLRLTRFSWRSRAFGDRSASLLAQSPALASLRHLELPFCDLTRESPGVLAASPHLSHLESLDLTGNLLDEGNLEPLLASSNLRRLADLNLSMLRPHGRFSPALLGRVCALPLRGLALRYNRLQDADLWGLARSARLQHLERLDLSHNNLEDNAVIALLENPSFGGLREVRLAGNLVGMQTRAALRRLGFAQRDDDPAWRRPGVAASP